MVRVVFPSDNSVRIWIDDAHNQVGAVPLKERLDFRRQQIDRAPHDVAVRGGASAALVIASNAPDIDALAAFRRGVASYLQWHRGPTHGLLGVVGLGALTAGIVWLAGEFRQQTDRDGPRASFAMLLGI